MGGVKTMKAKKKKKKRKKMTGKCVMAICLYTVNDTLGGTEAQRAR